MTIIDFPRYVSIRSSRLYHYVWSKIYNGVTSCGHSLKQFSKLLWYWFSLSGFSSNGAKNGNNFIKQDSSYSGNVIVASLLLVPLSLPILQASLSFSIYIKDYLR